MTRFLIWAFLLVHFIAQICDASELKSDCGNCRSKLKASTRKENSCVTLPQYTSKHCLEEREKNLKIQRQIYPLTTPPETAPETNAESSITKDNLVDFVTLPILNLTTPEVVRLSLANPDDRICTQAYLQMLTRNQGLLRGNTTFNPRNIKPFHNYNDYAELLDSYRKSQRTGGPFDEYFRYPSQEEYFKDIITSEVWQEDKVFTEQRLAGQNPMSLRKLTLRDYVMNKCSHYSPELDKALEEAVGRKTNMLKMVQKGVVYVLDYPLLQNLTNVPDILDYNPTDGREMKTSTSPLAVFVSVKNRKTKRYELKPVAIQTDYDSSSPVFSPTDGSKWLLAKEELQQADFIYSQVIEHLLKTHLTMEPICAILRRTMYKCHPLYDLLKWHCRNVHVTNSGGMISLLTERGALHSLFPTGHIGAVELLNKGYLDLSWAETDFQESLKKRGVNDRKTLPYYPYRDDGIIIWRLIRAFAKEYVNLYYWNKRSVQNDKELQNFANELSDEGVGPNGGLGKLKGFPASISTKQQLQDIVARIIFIPINHHAVNYPLAYYAGFVPNTPTKLYNDPRVPPEEFSFYSLPQSHVATIHVNTILNLASLHCDELFNYGSDLKDQKAGRLTQKYYKRLMGPIQKWFKNRNKRRLNLGHLTYPYFQPGWMPNSIAT